MKVIRNERNPILDLVNPLIDQAFGKGSQGNYAYANHSIVDGPDGVKEINGLEKIGVQIPYRICFIGPHSTYCQFVGEFEQNSKNKRDGSVLRVFSKFEPQARKYAELYEAKTGKEVEIRII